jgi:hypothetical protein
MAMMMVMSQHELSKLPDRAWPVNSKELMGTIGIHDGLHLLALDLQQRPMSRPAKMSSPHT